MSPEYYFKEVCHSIYKKGLKQTAIDYELSEDIIGDICL
jgi:hypothetical protein